MQMKKSSNTNPKLLKIHKSSNNKLKSIERKDFSSQMLCTARNG